MSDDTKKKVEKSEEISAIRLVGFLVMLTVAVPAAIVGWLLSIVVCLTIIGIPLGLVMFVGSTTILGIPFAFLSTSPARMERERLEKEQQVKANENLANLPELLKGLETNSKSAGQTA